jgi:uncharacterized protein YbjT (DUF2867 family)
MKVIITGATGMTGSIVLKHCIASPEITEIISVTRRPSDLVHDKLTEVTPNSFLDYSNVVSNFKNVDAAYYCLGVYTGQVPDDKFKEITYDYTLAFANALKSNSPEATFCFLSGAGADQKEKSKTSFARYKGMAENHLINLQFGRLSIFRPGYIYPVEPREEPNWMYRISRMLYPLFKMLGRNYSLKSTELGEAIFKAGFHQTPKVVLENRDILDFVEG